MPGNEWAVPTQDPNCDVKQYKTARCEECTALNQKMEVRMAYGHAEAVVLSNGKLNCVEVQFCITVGCLFYCHLCLLLIILTHCLFWFSSSLCSSTH